MNCEDGPMDAADASRVQPGCVGAEASVTWTPVKHLYYNQQVIGLSLWQCSSLYSVLQWSWAPKSPQSVRLMGAGRAMGARRPSGLGVRHLTVVPKSSLSSVWRLWPFAEEHLWAGPGPHVRFSPHSHENTRQEYDSLPTKKWGKISPCSKNTRSQNNSCWNTSIIRKEWWHHDRSHSLWRPCLLVVWSIDH